jgi:hypothetical protein
MTALLDPTGAIVTDFNINTVKNLLEESTLQNLREIQHKDAYGNDIGKCLFRPPAHTVTNYALQSIPIARTQLDLEWRDR